MDNINTILLVVATVIIIFFFLKRFNNLNKVNLERQILKEKTKEEILDFLGDREFTLKEIEEKFDLSHGTAWSYIEEFEKSGKIKQFGELGNTYYKKL